MRRAVLLALLLVVPTAGCLDFLEGQGEETLLVRNLDVQPIEVVLTITHEASGFQVFGESMVLRQSESREFALAMSAGEYRAQVATSNGLAEQIWFSVPERGDSAIELVVRRGSAKLTVS